MVQMVHLAGGGHAGPPYDLPDLPDNNSPFSLPYCNRARSPNPAPVLSDRRAQGLATQHFECRVGEEPAWRQGLAGRFSIHSSTQGVSGCHYLKGAAAVTLGERRIAAAEQVRVEGFIGLPLGVALDPDRGR